MASFYDWRTWRAASEGYHEVQMGILIGQCDDDSLRELTMKQSDSFLRRTARLEQARRAAL